MLCCMAEAPSICRCYLGKAAAPAEFTSATNFEKEKYTGDPVLMANRACGTAAGLSEDFSTTLFL